jgi:hypothetical protein
LFHARKPSSGAALTPEAPPADRAKNRSLFFDELLDAKVREFNPRYIEAEGAWLMHTFLLRRQQRTRHLFCCESQKHQCLRGSICRL